ncbi:MAG: hypothetical protein ACYDEY_13520 [Acidimicrobiales bacterium]
MVVESLRLKEASVVDSPSTSKAALFGSVPGEERSAALWPRDLETTEASMKSVHNAISMLRECLGAEYVPEASKGSWLWLSPKIRSD